jgi:fatty acid desaturase
MNTSIALDRPDVTLARAPHAPIAGIADDKAMLRTAAELTRDLNAPKPWIYWTDMLATAIIGYAALLTAMFSPLTGLAIVSGVLAVLALYRASMFVHEIAHIKHSSVPGFRLGWNLLIGIPTLVPSFMYEGVHNLHHNKTRYGTAEDPEYLPLALMKPWTLPVFVLVSLAAPVALLVRYSVLAPISLVSRSARTVLVERYSSLSINPAFRRRPAEGAARSKWIAQEIGASIWAIALVALAVTGILPLKSFLIFLGVASGIAVINQVRTLVAHLWENEGETISVTAQYLDSVNVPPPGMLPALWAPVGLRYHALHHLLPSVPYHALGEAHRRLTAALGEASPYHKASYPGLTGLVDRLVRSTMVVRR